PSFCASSTKCQSGGTQTGSVSFDLMRSLPMGVSKTFVLPSTASVVPFPVEQTASKIVCPSRRTYSLFSAVETRMTWPVSGRSSVVFEMLAIFCCSVLRWTARCAAAPRSFPVLTSIRSAISLSTTCTRARRRASRMLIHSPAAAMPASPSARTKSAQEPRNPIQRRMSEDVDPRFVCDARPDGCEIGLRNHDRSWLRLPMKRRIGGRRRVDAIVVGQRDDVVAEAVVHHASADRRFVIHPIDPFGNGPVVVVALSGHAECAFERHEGPGAAAARDRLRSADLNVGFARDIVADAEIELPFGRVDREIELVALDHVQVVELCIELAAQLGFGHVHVG